MDPEKELTIRDLSVIENPLRTVDPCEPAEARAWSFSAIAQKVADQAGAADASQFVKDWLDTWTQPQLVNGHLLEPIAVDAFITIPWLLASGGERLDLQRAPFRLLSIVNRIDLAQQDGKGEFRIVYGATSAVCEPLHFAVIFEFELPVQGEEELRTLAQRWHALGSLPFGESYNAALQAITDELSLGRLKRVNTVEEEASVLEWNFRSFGISGQSLVNVPMFQSPDVTEDGDPELVAWVNANQSDILADRHVVPDSLLGGEAHGFPWRGIGFEDPIQVRFHFALATCNGCHGDETGTFFVHTGRRRRGEPTPISEYMTGETIVDPGGQVRVFNELQRRADFLQSLTGP